MSRWRSSKRSGSSSSMWPATMPPRRSPPNPGAGRDRKVEPTERNPPGRRDRARVEDLELGQDHPLTLPAGLAAAPAGGAQMNGRSSFAEGGGEVDDLLVIGRRRLDEVGQRTGPGDDAVPPRRRPCRRARWPPRPPGPPRPAHAVAPPSSGSWLSSSAATNSSLIASKLAGPPSGERGAGRGEGGDDLVDARLVVRRRRTARRRRARTGSPRSPARRAGRRSCRRPTP